MRHRDKSAKRFSKGHWLMTRLGQILNVPRKKLGYIFKDELADSIDTKDSTTAHINFLLSNRHIEDKESVCHILRGLWLGPKKKSPRFGLCSIKVFDSTRAREGIDYTIKTRKFKKIIFNDMYLSPALKKEIHYHQQFNKSVL